MKCIREGELEGSFPAVYANRKDVQLEQYYHDAPGIEKVSVNIISALSVKENPVIITTLR
jgi:hypothetical protein